MKQIVGTVISIVLSVGLQTKAFADTYKCTMADGRSTYQATPCMTGVEKAVDDSDARAKRKDDEEKKTFEIRRQKMDIEKNLAEQQDLNDLLAINKSILGRCLEDKNCASTEYRRALMDMPKSFVLEFLGRPGSEQNIEGRTIHYFTVPSSSRSGTSKLQVTYKGYSTRFFNLRNGASVDSVNIY